jgi:uncharacterized membrane protein
MMSQNRQAEKDRLTAQNDYQTDIVHLSEELTESNDDISGNS